MSRSLLSGMGDASCVGSLSPSAKAFGRPEKYSKNSWRLSPDTVPNRLHRVLGASVCRPVTVAHPTMLPTGIFT